MSGQLSAEVLVERNCLGLNRKYATSHRKPPNLHDDNYKLRQSSGMLIVSCADPRVIPEQFLGFRVPDEKPLAIPVVRVIGGRAKRALTDIVGLDSFFGLSTVMIIHHTDCGLTHATNEKIRHILKQRLPEDPTIDTLEFGEIKKRVLPFFAARKSVSDKVFSLEMSVLEDMQFLRNSPLVRADLVIKGYLYDLETGRLTEVNGDALSR
ncbi:carbonic anhydrase [Lipomyces starkeyi]